GVSQKISELGETDIRPLEFGAAQHQIQIDFFALTFDAGENVRYQYRLDENEWSNPSKQQSLDLDLSSGKHSLLMRWTIDARTRYQNNKDGMLGVTLEQNLTIKTGRRYSQVSSLGGRSTVGQQTLTLLIGVRIPASQPIFNPSI